MKKPPKRPRPDRRVLAQRKRARRRAMNEKHAGLFLRWLFAKERQEAEFAHAHPNLKRANRGNKGVRPSRRRSLKEQSA